MKLVWKTLLPVAIATTLFAADAEYDPLWLYQGHWRAARKAGDSGPAQVDLVNQCGRIGRFFGCQQTVDGKTGALVLYVPAEQPGHYHTQAILPDGKAAGRGELTIEGDRWTFLSKDTEGEKATQYRTTNVFSGKNRIHFEQSESTDGEHWVVKAFGDETKVD